MFEEKLPEISAILKQNMEFERMDHDHFLNKDDVNNFNEENKKLLSEIGLIRNLNIKF